MNDENKIAAQVSEEWTVRKVNDTHFALVFNGKDVGDVGPWLFRNERMPHSLAETINANIAALRLRVGAAEEALRMLHDFQNGCPLPSYEEGWNEAMRLTEAAISCSPPMATKAE